MLVLIPSQKLEELPSGRGWHWDKIEMRMCEARVEVSSELVDDVPDVEYLARKLAFDGLCDSIDERTGKRIPSIGPSGRIRWRVEYLFLDCCDFSGIGPDPARGGQCLCIYGKVMALPKRYATKRMIEFLEGRASEMDMEKALGAWPVYHSEDKRVCSMT